MTRTKASNRSVLVVTHELAQEVDGVIDRLRSRGLGVERWNLCQYPEVPATASWRGIRLGSARDPTKAHAGWLHNSGSYSINAVLSGLERELSQRECDAFWHGALSTAANRWLNEPDDVVYASNKLRQLRIVENLGIPVPSYLASNDVDAIAAFRDRHQHTVIKAIRGGYVVHPERSVKLVTKRIDKKDQSFADGLCRSPVLVQEEITKAYEVRVTVVGDSAFAMFVDCRNLPSEIVDIRLLDYTHERWRFSAGETSHPVLKASIIAAKALSLCYAGVDWAVAQDGRAYFLESNPLGSFKWSELCTGHDITGAIADALVALANEDA